MSTSDSLQLTFNYFNEKYQNKERNYYHGLLSTLDETLSRELFKISKNDSKIFNTIMSNTFNKLETNISQPTLLELCKNNFCEIDKLNNLSKQKINEYLNIIISKKYELDETDYSKAEIYYYKLFIPIHMKWIKTPLSEIKNDIDEYNDLIKCNELLFNHSIHYNNTLWFDYNIYRQFFIDKNINIYNVIIFLKKLTKKYNSENIDDKKNINNENNNNNIIHEDLKVNKLNDKEKLEKETLSKNVKLDTLEEFKLKVKKIKKYDTLTSNRKNIPAILKSNAWDLYIGSSIGEAKCFCCRKIQIKQSIFECGHVISRKDNGPDIIENLRPICSTCNKSMGTQNMYDFINVHGLWN